MDRIVYGLSLVLQRWGVSQCELKRSPRGPISHSTATSAPYSERVMWLNFVVQRGLTTPTVPFLREVFIGIILGLVVEFAFMGLLT